MKKFTNTRVRKSVAASTLPRKIFVAAQPPLATSSTKPLRRKFWMHKHRSREGSSGTSLLLWRWPRWLNAMHYWCGLRAPCIFTCLRFWTTISQKWPSHCFFFYDHARVIVLLRKILIFSVSINRKYLHFKLFRVSNYPNPMHNLKHNQCVG